MKFLCHRKKESSSGDFSVYAKAQTGSAISLTFTLHCAQIEEYVESQPQRFTSQTHC